MANIRSVLRRHRLRYLKQQLDQAARRRRELIFVLFTLVPISPVVFGWPLSIVALTNACHGPLGFFTILRDSLILLSTLGAALLWVRTMQDAIGGSRFNDYVRTLPIPMPFHDFLDLLALCLTNFPLWIMVLVSLAIAPYHRLSPLESWLFFGRLVVIILLLLSTQLRFLRQRGGIAFLGVGVTVLLNVGASLACEWHMILVIGILLLLTFSLCRPRFIDHKYPFAKSNS